MSELGCEVTHGSPFRYCGVCGWMEETKPDPDAFLKKAKKLVADYSEPLVLMEKDVYIVWFAKVLGNWKALISTDVVDGMYWEVTYNGAKKEAYIDTYTKFSNKAVADQ